MYFLSIYMLILQKWVFESSQIKFFTWKNFILFIYLNFILELLLLKYFLFSKQKIRRVRNNCEMWLLVTAS